MLKNNSLCLMAIWNKVSIFEMCLPRAGEDKKVSDARQESHLINHSIFTFANPQTSISYQLLAKRFRFITP